MRYFKFTNKDSGASGHLPETTINRILGNAKRAKTIEVLYECDSNGNPLQQNESEVTTEIDVDINQNENGNQKFKSESESEPKQESESRLQEEKEQYSDQGPGNGSEENSEPGNFDESTNRTEGDSKYSDQ